MSEATTRRLVDRTEIEALLHRYCRCADFNDPEGLAGCFTADCLAFYAPGPPSVGARERRAQAERDLARFSATSHHLSGVAIEFEEADPAGQAPGDLDRASADRVDPDRARVESVLYAWHRPREGDRDWHLWGRYHDVVVRTPLGWLIAERRLLVAGRRGFPDGWSWLVVDRLDGDSPRADIR